MPGARLAPGCPDRTVAQVVAVLDLSLVLCVECRARRVRPLAGRIHGRLSPLHTHLLVIADYAEELAGMIAPSGGQAGIHPVARPAQVLDKLRNCHRSALFQRGGDDVAGDGRLWHGQVVTAARDSKKADFEVMACAAMASQMAGKSSS
jgi:hypothetical protein